MPFLPFLHTAPISPTSSDAPPSRHGFRPVSRAAHFALLSFVLSAGVGHSAQAQTQTQAASETARAYQMEPGPLGRALSGVASAASMALSFDPALTQGLNSPALAGSFSPREALQHLLQGSGLQLERRADGSYTLQKMESESSGASAHQKDKALAGTLAEVRVTANTERSAITEGTGSYTTPATAAATGLNLSMRDTPQSVSVLTREQIDDQNLLSLNDAMKSVTGIYAASSDSDRTDFYSRGFYVDNLQYDGVPTSIGLSFYGESGNDTTIYDRIEVVRGATGLLTGAGNPSASINLVRKRAQSKVFTGTASVGLGSWNQRRATVDLSTPLTSDGRIRARLAGMTEERDSHVDLYHARKQVLYGVVDADLTASTTASIGFDYQSNRPTGSTWGGLPLLFSDGTPTNWATSKTTGADWTHWSSTNRSLFASVEHRFDNGWKLKTNLAHRESDYDAKLLYLYRQPDAVTGTGLVALPNYSEYTFQQNSVDVQATGAFALAGRKHEAVVGLSGTRSREHKSGHARVGDLAGTGDFYEWDGSYQEPTWGAKTTSALDRTSQNGIYGALRFSLADPLKLIVGGRQSRWQVSGLNGDREHEVFTPYAGLVLDLNEQFSAYASYTDIFQPQNYRNREGAYLDPVTGKSFELGIKGEHLDGKLNSSLSIFRIQQDNVAQLDADNVVPGTTDFAYVGAKGIVAKGVEAQVSGDIATGWKLSAGASHTNVKDADGQAANTWAPKTQLQLFTSYQLRGDWQGLTVGTGVNWQSANSAQFTVAGKDVKYVQKSFAIVNLMARYAFTPQLSLQVNLNNLLNKKHYVNIDGQGQFGTPRNAMAVLKYRF